MFRSADRARVVAQYHGPEMTALRRLVGDREDEMKDPHKATEVYPQVVVDAHIMHGVPVIKGTRIPARAYAAK